MITFTQPFHRVYSRTRRNLRCFPACRSAMGHVHHGFCGEPITLAFAAETFPNLSECDIYADFVPLDDDAPLGGERIVGEVVDDCIVFNRNCKPYVYDWVSSKHKAKVQHVFRVHITQSTGQPVLSLDSAPFTVSAHLANLDDMAQARSPIRIVLSAIRTHLPKSYDDGDWTLVVENVAGDAPASLGAWIGGDIAVEASMDTNLVARLVAIEELCTILKALCDFSLVRFRSWSDEAAVVVDVDAFLLATHDISLAQLAQKLGENHIFDPALDNDDFKNAYQDMARSAINGARAVLGPQLVATIRPIFVGNFEATFKYSKSYFENIAAMHKAMGWNSLVQHTVYDVDKVKFLMALKIARPTEIQLAFGTSLPPTSNTWLSLIPSQALHIGAFQLGMCSGPGEHVMFVWPLRAGLCLVLFYSPLQRRISVLSATADGQKLDQHMLYQEYQSGEWATRYEFRHELVREREN